MREREDLTTPCNDYGQRVCAACKDWLDGGERRRCYRKGRAVKRRIEYRALLASIPSWPRSIWSAFKQYQPATVESLTDCLKRLYGPKWEGPYKDRCLAKELEGYEHRRWLMFGQRKPRRWAEICSSLGLREGKSPLEKLLYADRPLFNLIPKVIW